MSATMSETELENTIDAAFEKRDGIGPATKGPVRDAVEAALDLLDSGQAIDAGSLALAGTTLSWTDGGAQRTAPLP